MKLSDLVSLQSSQAAILLETALSDKALARSFTPTQAAVKILNRIVKAVQPDAAANERALNLFGTYGAGKSRLAVLIGQALRDGVGSAEFQSLLDKLKQMNSSGLAGLLKNRFLPRTDADARPYVLVPIYGNKAGGIQAALLESLYAALKEEGLDPTDILPKTTFDIAVERLDTMLLAKADLAEDYLPGLGLGDAYPQIVDVRTGLKNYDNKALDVFKIWHHKVALGASFSPENYGARQVHQVYRDAGSALAKHGYGGIAILWDEFGYNLEDMLKSSTRHAQTEIEELQRFVEYACEPSVGHTLFIGLTHVALAEYGSRSDASDGIRDNLSKIEGRFTFERVEMRAAESEGYHLLATQIVRTDLGRTKIAEAESQAQKIINTCVSLPLFSHLGSDVGFVAKQCYPLHPVTTAALLALSNKYAAATRTAFHFLPQLREDKRFELELTEEGLFRDELVRVNELVYYYSKEMRSAGIGESLDSHLKNISQIQSDGAASDIIEERNKVLSTIFLSSLLPSGFQSSDSFLAGALHDASFDSNEAAPLRDAIRWLSNAGLIWKNDTTSLWQAGGDGAIDVEKMIDESCEAIPKLSVAKLLADYPDLAADALPMLGHHDLSPSPCGIVRSYEVVAKTPAELAHLRLDAYSAKVVVVLTSNAKEAADISSALAAKQAANVFYWLSFTEHNGLDKLMRRYLGILRLLDQPNGDATKIRLGAKFEAVRTQIFENFGRLFGREGLALGTTKVLQQGGGTSIEVTSWHGFKLLLQQVVNETYPGEVAVRAPHGGRNRLIDDGEAKSADTQKIVAAILERATKPVIDMFCGFADTSQRAAIFDGLIGANDLLIDRGQGLELKKLHELSGNIKTVVEDIRSLLFKRRDKAYPMTELRKHFGAKPYGIPAGALPLLIAFAVRDDIDRLTWPGGGDAAKNISEGIVNEKIGVRFADFSGRQLNFLSLLQFALDDMRGEKKAWPANKQEAAKQAIDELKVHIKAVPEEVLKHPKLDRRFKDIADACRAVGVTQHHIVDGIAKSVDPECLYGAGELSYEQNKTGKAILIKVLSSPGLLLNEKRAEFVERVRAVVDDLHEDSNSEAVLAMLATMPGASSVCPLLEKQFISEIACVQVLERLRDGESFAEMSETSAGIALGQLTTLIKVAKASCKTPPPTPSGIAPLPEYDVGSIEENPCSGIQNSDDVEKIVHPHDAGNVRRSIDMTTDPSEAGFERTPVLASGATSSLYATTVLSTNANTTQTVNTPSTQRSTTENNGSSWRMSVAAYLTQLATDDTVNKQELVSRLEEFIANLEEA